MRALAVALALASVTSVARAECPSQMGPSETTTDARIAWIEARLAHTSHRATVWLRAWEIGLVGATAIDLAFIPILGDTPSHRIDFGLGAATTIIGIVPLLIFEPRVIDDHRALDAKISAGGDRCAILADAEQRLVASAASQHRYRAWYAHAGNVILNGGVTLLFGAFHHWTSGILNGVGGALVGELILYTEPVDQIDDLAEYRRGQLTATHRGWQLLPGPHGAGLGFGWAFD